MSNHKCFNTVLFLYLNDYFVWIFRGALFYSNEIQQYAIPFMGSDPSVVKRTQRFLVEEHEATPVCMRIKGYEMLSAFLFSSIFVSNVSDEDNLFLMIERFAFRWFSFIKNTLWTFFFFFYGPNNTSKPVLLNSRSSMVHTLEWEV